ncbi:protein-tyrosine-phosphatase [Malassezia psittaci]|uniref:M-phase inducer phosphatase n=1 Tax=Malassezia psittaci TaxID=1821823 RepID=A0AAF0F8E3_9BASI|nr:protein-tyrosine-phosphatase [Malassezia psittaci]
MAAILSSPHLATAAWGMDEGQLLSSPAGRDLPLFHELDHSFGSSMSISSADSPRKPLRSQGMAPSLDKLWEDPFAAPSTQDQRSAGERPAWDITMRRDSIYPKSSPHAMEISSPATLQLMPTNDFSSSIVDTESLPITSNQAGLQKGPFARPLFSRRLSDRTTRRSLPQLPSASELHPSGSQNEPPLKRRLSSLRRQHPPKAHPEFSQSSQDDCDRPGLSCKGTEFPLVRGIAGRSHTRSQSAAALLPHDFDMGRAQPEPSPLSVCPTSAESADDSWTLSGPEPSKRPCFAPATSDLPSVSPQSMRDYFFNPTSPNVCPPTTTGLRPSVFDMPCIISESSPNSSHYPVNSADGLPDASGIFSQSNSPFKPLPEVLISEASRSNVSQENLRPVSSSILDAESGVDELDDSLMLGSSAPELSCGSPVRSTYRKARAVGRDAQRAQTLMEVTTQSADKENESLCASGNATRLLGSSPTMSGFGSYEMDSKTLPCFSVKSDGLMRVTSDTVSDLLHGKYDDRVSGFQIVDCRFEYEYEGGHIQGAKNLSTVEQVQQYFLTPGQGLHRERPLPHRTQSGTCNDLGDKRKFLLIFHCEFSWKRGPSMALALRAADRSMASDYPRCHFPDVYVLQGGYAEFFRTHPELCCPQDYVTMDDPRFLRRRSEELVGFRKQFARNRSFAYGDQHHAALTAIASRENASTQFKPTVLTQSRTETGRTLPSFDRNHNSMFSPTTSNFITTQPIANMAPVQERDTSFSSNPDSSFEVDTSFSPCAAAIHRRPEPSNEIGRAHAPPTLMHAFARRTLLRAETMPSVAQSMRFGEPNRTPS